MLFIIVFLLNAITTFGQNMQIPDTLRGMSFADSIVESKHITKKRYFNHNFKILKKELGNKDSIVVHNSNVKEFIGVLEDMGDFGIIKNPYHMVILNSATLLIVSGHCGQNRPECDFSCSNRLFAIS